MQLAQDSNSHARNINQRVGEVLGPDGVSQTVQHTGCRAMTPLCSHRRGRPRNLDMDGRRRDAESVAGGARGQHRARLVNQSSVSGKGWTCQECGCRTHISGHWKFCPRGGSEQSIRTCPMYSAWGLEKHNWGTTGWSLQSH